MADAQLTRYRQGHFLTAHDDHVEGKQRYYAYVLGLTDGWRIDWGGLLAFHGEDDNVAARNGCRAHDFEQPLGCVNDIEPTKREICRVGPLCAVSLYQD